MGVIRLTEDMFKAKEENLSQFNNSIFKDCYIQASKVLLEIVQNNKEAKRKINEKNNESINQSVEYHNNIIAFSGERGSGKTSSMVSFYKSLKSCDYLDDDSDLKDNYNKLNKYHFHLPSIIDPSVLTHKDSIIEIIVGRMFEEISQEKHFDDVASKRNLIQRFDKVYKNIRIINAEQNSIFEQNQDNLEVLMDMASIVDLKNNLYQLFNCFLEYMNRNSSNKDKYLVIAIDDLDMNMDSADKMIEEIRKYLIIPNVVILIALRMPQMIQVVKQRNMVQLKETTEFYSKLHDNEFIKRLHYDINTKTQKYLDKIFPETHLINMPYIWSEKTKVSIEATMEDIPIYKLVKDIFMYSAGYVIGSDIHLRTILPRSLRGFIELIALLDYKKVYKLENDRASLSKEEIVNNINKLKRYYEEKFVNVMIDNQKQNILKSIFEEDISTLNKKLLIDLHSIITKKINFVTNEVNAGSVLEFDDENNSKTIEIYSNRRINVKIFNYLDKLNKNKFKILSTSVSIGDLICLLNIYEGTDLDADERNFYELFKLLYTFRFIEFICIDNIENSDAKMLFPFRLQFKSKLKKQEIYNNFVYDIIGKYFDMSDSRYRLYLNWPIRIEGNKNNRYSEKIENVFDTLYYPSKNNPSIYIKGYEFDDKSLKEEYGSLFYQFLQPTFNSTEGIKTIRNKRTIRKINAANTISKLISQFDNKEIFGYQNYYYGPFRMMQNRFYKFNTNFNTNEELEIKFLQLLSIDFYMLLLEDFLYYLKNRRIDNDKDMLKEIDYFITNYMDDERYLDDKDIDFIAYNVEMFTKTVLPNIEDIRKVIQLLNIMQKFILSFDSGTEVEKNYKSMSRRYSIYISKIRNIDFDDYPKKNDVDNILKAMEKAFIKYGEIDWSAEYSDNVSKIVDSLKIVVTKINELSQLLIEDIPEEGE